ncbi:RNA recognition motif domain [Arabidopsis thaliana x Arabidopsis arenosa]|uniref:RNA recognition motif domain n=2 Tax=Arabidopsis TaxID=3701 RepID=A0A8T1YFW4_ARASU|nr:RNA recognition motif domain [Arabidopsis thaliana x Arabidopsis arenosa]KAG7544926.1 RNA recognition motif domain [Arabidopsis suecica]
MADSPRRRDSRSPSPRKERARSRSRSRSRSRLRSRSRSLPRPISPSRSRGRSRSRSRGRSEVENPGTTLYVTGLSTRVTDKDLEAHFAKEGKVASCFLVMEPRTRVSRGFAFVTMDSVKDAERCIKYLNQSVLEGRYITVERKILHQATIRDDKSTHPCSTSLSETQLDQSNRQLKQLFQMI